MSEIQNISIGLSSPVEHLRFVGVRNLSRLKKLGIKSVKHLLWHLPARYEDFSQATPISDAVVGEKVNIQGEIVRISMRRIFPRRLTVVDAVISDISGSIKAVWFNQPYIVNTLVEGSVVSLAGKVSLGKQGLYLSSPTYEKISSDSAGSAVKDLRHTSGLVPVYPETEGITSKYLRFLIGPLLKTVKIEDPLPLEIRKRNGFFDLKYAINNIHHPADVSLVDAAKRRLAFDDLLSFQLKALMERRRMNQLKSVPIQFDQDLIRGFMESLPFEMTHDQKVSAWEILKDIQKSYPMNRLLEGDVGSGKTVVALVAALQVIKNGHQAVFLAPTEVLAVQHERTALILLDKLDVDVVLLTGAFCRINGQKTDKKVAKRKILDGQAMIVIGTHAVIQKDVKFSKLALVVIDEQHRFGIEQRSQLLKSQEIVPHLLSMTATPIPRTLALTIFGDLDISLIKEKPKDRQRIITQIISAKQKEKTYEFLRQEIKNGRQIFVICPRIEAQATTVEDKNETKPASKPLKQTKMNALWAEVKAVQDEYEHLQKEIFPELKVAMLHGKMKPKEKESIMNEFKNGWYDILVSTSVIEVGVDVPNASVMLIESSERFGLAQLHQFRGRVGRAEHQSYCFLFTSGDTWASERLKTLAKSDNGFELAEKDLSLRGPGEFFGIKQSGMPDLSMAALADVELIKTARYEARLMLKEDPSLKKYPLLQKQLEDFQKMVHFE